MTLNRHASSREGFSARRAMRALPPHTRSFLAREPRTRERAHCGARVPEAQGTLCSATGPVLEGAQSWGRWGPLTPAPNLYFSNSAARNFISVCSCIARLVSPGADVGESRRRCGRTYRLFDLRLATGQRRGVAEPVCVVRRVVVRREGALRRGQPVLSTQRTTPHNVGTTRRHAMYNDMRPTGVRCAARSAPCALTRCTPWLCAHAAWRTRRCSPPLRVA